MNTKKPKDEVSRMIYKPHFEKIDTRKKVEIVIEDLSMLEKIALLESLCKMYRRENSKKINDRQMGR